MKNVWTYVTYTIGLILAFVAGGSTLMCYILAKALLHNDSEKKIRTRRHYNYRDYED